MKFTSTLIILLPLSISASSLPPSLTKRQGPGPDCLGDGGPSNEAKNAVRDFVKNQQFAGGSGQYCAPGCNLLECAEPYCAICQGAYINISLEADDTYCFEYAQIEEALNKMPEGGDRCTVATDGEAGFKQVTFGGEGSFSDSAECPNRC